MTAYQKGWDRLSNGALLEAAEEAGIDLLITTDRRLRYQQNLDGRRIGILVLTGSTKWSRVRLQADVIAAHVNSFVAGSYVEISIPFENTQD